MNNEIAKCLARLTGLKSNIPTGWVLAKYAIEFNSIVENLEKITEEDLSEFKIPPNEVKPRVSVASSFGNQYTSESYCDRDFIKMKLDSILSYFTILLQPTEIKNKIGFTVEDN